MRRNCITILTIAVTFIITASCTKMFPNEKLDHMWRLDQVEYRDGKDFNGLPCNVEQKRKIWYCFQRDIIEIRNNNNMDVIFGVISEDGNEIRMDFATFNTGYAPDSLSSDLNFLGIGSPVITYHIDKLDRSGMILSDSKTILSFTRW